MQALSFGAAVRRRFSSRRWRVAVPAIAATLVAGAALIAGPLTAQRRGHAAVAGPADHRVVERGRRHAAA